MNIARAATKLFTARLASQIIGFLGLTFFARQLGAEQMGIFFLFQAVLFILAIPADVGIKDGIEKRISEGENPGKILTTGLLLKLVFSLGLGVGLLAIRDIVNNYIGGQVVFFLVLALVLNALSEVAIRTLSGELRVGETASLQLARQVVWVGVGALLVWRGFGYLGLIYSFILGLGVVFFWGMYKRSTKFGSISQDHASSLWAYSKYSFVGAVGGTFYSWMDVAVIGLFLPPSHVGAYEMAWRVGTVVTLLSSSIAMTVFPQVSEWDSENSREKIESLIPQTITPSLILVIPAFFGTILLSREILGILFGQEFEIAWRVLILFMGINFVQATVAIFSRILKAINYPELVAKARIISLLINIILNIVFVWQFGIIGAAIATGLALMTFTVLILLYLKNHVRIKFPYHEIGWCIGASILMALVIVVVQLLVVINTYHRLFGIVSLGIAIYLILILIYKPFRSKFMDATQNILV